jgi:hypothetical protein
MLAYVGLSERERKLVALFGPRGLSTLLFMLLPVFAGVPGSEGLFTIACLVTLLSVAIHGGGMAIFLRANTPPGSRPVPAGGARPPASRAVEQSSADTPGDTVPEKIELKEVGEMLGRGEPVVMLDSRTEKGYKNDPGNPGDAVRIPPDDPVRAAKEKQLSQHATLVVYCA